MYRSIASAAIEAARLPKTTTENAQSLLQLASDDNGSVHTTYSAVRVLWSLTSDRSIRRHLTEMQEAQIIHYTTNLWVYVTFLAWPPVDVDNSAIARVRATIGATIARTRAIVLPEDDGENSEIARTRAGLRVHAQKTAELRVHAQGKSAYIELNEGMNIINSPLLENSFIQSIPADEQNLSFAILSDPAIRIRRVKAKTLAEKYPFEVVRAFCCDFVEQGRKPGVDAGLVVFWLESAEVVPPLVMNDLYQRHRTAEEIAAEEERERQATEEHECWEERRRGEAVCSPETVSVSSAARDVWAAALADLSLSMPGPTFETWLRDTDVLGYEDGVYVVGVPNVHAKDWLHNRLRPQIKRVLSRLQQCDVEVSFALRPREVRR